ncbi:MAG: hypothetical protein GX240_07095 [Candidatus Atribacteria bacterium]|nr:hypothetical protein [Candidatus Atribacteria bacterium]
MTFGKSTCLIKNSRVIFLEFSKEVPLLIKNPCLAESVVETAIANGMVKPRA